MAPETRDQTFRRVLKELMEANPDTPDFLLQAAALDMVGITEDALGRKGQQGGAWLHHAGATIDLYRSRSSKKKVN